MRTLLAVSLLMALACATGEGTGDTGATTAGGCPAGSGIAADARRVYGFTDAWEEAEGVGGTWTVEVEEVRADGAWTMVTDATYDVPDYDAYTVVLTSEGWCDDEGSWLAEEYAEITVALGGQAADGWQRTTYEEPMLVVPAGLGDGAAWTLAYAGTIASEDGEEAFEAEIEMEARDAGEVEVAAGTFAALALYADGELARYLDAAVGDLGDGDSYELLAY
ncbi:MAG: hypothetical protein ACOZNI_35465 [Myxococcota bacterium]